MEGTRVQEKGRDRGDRCRESQTLRQMQRQRLAVGRQGREKDRGQGGRQKHRRPQDRDTRCLWVGPGDGSEPLQPWRDRNSLSGPGLEGVLQEGFAPGSLAFRLEVFPQQQGSVPSSVRGG